MTREEAIENIKEFIDTYITCHGEEDTVAVSIDNVDVEALDMAIKALQEPILDKVKQAREDIENEVKFWSEPSKYNNIVLAVNKGMAKTQSYAKAQSYKHCLEIIDKLIAESER